MSISLRSGVFFRAIIASLAYWLFGFLARIIAKPERMSPTDKFKIDEDERRSMRMGR
jgi:hypothetical protein